MTFAQPFPGASPTRLLDYEELADWPPHQRLPLPPSRRRGRDSLPHHVGHYIRFDPKFRQWLEVNRHGPDKYEDTGRPHL